MLYIADTIFLNGNVLTMNPGHWRAEAIAIRNDKILAVGKNEEIKELAGQDTEVIDLEGRTLMPGFNDAHSHMLMFGTGLMEVDCSAPRVKSIGDIKRLIAERAKATPQGEWIRGWGYDDTKLEENRYPNRWDLDEAAPNHPVMISRTCCHMIACNSKALEIAGINKDTSDPVGGEIVRDSQTGEPTGLLQEDAQPLVKDMIPPYTKKDVTRGIKLMSQKYVSQGITSCADASTLIKLDGEMEAWQEAKKNGDLLVRTYLMVGPEIADKINNLRIITGFGDDMLKFGPVKMFTDGGVGGATAALSAPYAHQPDTKGILYMSQAEVDQKIKKAHDNGYQIAIHAIGDQAIEMVCNAFEKAFQGNPRPHRHRIEHCQVCPPHLQKRIAALGLIAVMQPAFLYWLGDSHITNLGRERVAYEFPLRSMLKLGVTAPLSSDRPVIDGNPVYGLYTAVTRKTESGDHTGTDECISIEDALRMYTVAGAYASYEEDIKGTIEPRKLADIIVLSDDPTRINSEELLNLEVEMTMVGGKIVYGDLDRCYRLKRQDI